MEVESVISLIPFMIPQENSLPLCVFLIMGAYIDSDGHAYEKDWYGNITDHGQVTKPGPVF